MAAQATSQRSGGSDSEGSTRRDFIYVAAGGMAAIGTAAFVWPFIASMNPSKDVQALSAVELDLAPIELGQRVTVQWRGRPVFVDHRTPERIEAARRDDNADLPDPEPDSARVQRPEWLIVVGVCTHLGCIPLGQGEASALGDYGGWFCPCHGSHYDTSARVRKGPAPKNLVVPDYAFTSDTSVRIG